MVLLRTHSCTITDIIGALKCKVLEHYSSVCAACEVTELLVVFSSFLYICVLLIVYSLCSSADLANKRVHYFLQASMLSLSPQQ